jgi:hypothetical protein
MIQLPKAYLSWSQLRTWLEDKDRYRDRYYRGIDTHSSRELLFGSEVAKGLEDGTIKVPGLVQYAVQEEQIKVDIEGVPFFGYIDQFDPRRLKFREIKTGKMKPNGGMRWTQREVDNHGQLDTYSLLIQEKYGSVDDECHLDWIVTRNKPVTMEFDGHVLEAEGREVEMTGEVVTYARVITQTERERMRMLIATVAREIEADYARFLMTEGTAPSAPLPVPAL